MMNSNVTDSVHMLKRCTRCILPETMPFIEFDEEGLCNYCRTYKKQQYLGEEKLKQDVQKLQPNERGRDSLVAFSGGRDSSYGMHYFVKELGLHPVAFTYDWGMATDIAVRNQKRMCDVLGVKLYTVTADLRMKRNNIRRNVLAWLKNPDLGMVPLFMAGDKQYFYHANRVQKKLQIDTTLLATNPFEKTYFKSGFCGVKPEVLLTGDSSRAVEQMPGKSVLQMGGYYLKQYARNPHYLNRSLFDTAKATASAYMTPHKYLRLFDYIPWDEEEINDTLINQYGWETATDTKSTWRIGDGTAAFYNYIYCTVAGFTENDTLRSNQIREGMITRERALELVQEENQPRYASMQWYFDVIGVPMEEALRVVQGMKKLYVSE